jgi:hypothetical protein
LHSEVNGSVNVVLGGCVLMLNALPGIPARHGRRDGFIAASADTFAEVEELTLSRKFSPHLSKA